MNFEEIENFEYCEAKKWFKKILDTQSPAAQKRLKELIILTYMPLAKQIARNLARRSDDPVEDIIQVGSIGLIKAVDNFNPALGASFKTYATYYITGEIRHYLRDKAKLVKVPRGIYELSYRVNSFIKELTEKLGMPPSEDEIASEMNLPSAKIQEARTAERRITPISMSDMDEGDEFSISLEEKIGDENYSEIFENFENRIILNEAIRTLGDIERETIELNFFEGVNQREIADRLGLTKMQVSRIIKRALKKLFEYVSEKGVQNDR